MVYQDNVKAKDMTLADIVRAIGKLQNSGLPIANEIHILNYWQ